MQSLPIMLLLLPFLLLLLRTPPAHAQLHWPQRQVTLAAEPGAERVAASFAFRNTGETAVRIVQLQSSCGCTMAGLEKKRYEPGEAGEITAIFTIGERRGRQSKTILVRTDHAAQPVTRLTLTVDVPERVTLTPRFLYWRAEEPRAPKRIAVRVREAAPAAPAEAPAEAEPPARPADTASSSAAPTPPAAPSLSVTSSDDRVRAAVEPVPDEPGRYDLVVHPSSELTPARLTLTVTWPDGTTEHLTAHARVFPGGSTETKTALALSGDAVTEIASSGGTVP